MFAARLAWVSIAARGVPAVPDVNSSTATSSSAGGRRGAPRGVGQRVEVDAACTARPAALTSGTPGRRRAPGAASTAVELPLELGGRRGRVERDADRARVEGGQVGGDERHAVGADDRDAVAGLDAVVAEQRGEPGGRVGERPVRGAPAALVEQRRRVRRRRGGAASSTPARFTAEDDRPGAPTGRRAEVPQPRAWVLGRAGRPVIATLSWRHAPHARGPEPFPASSPSVAGLRPFRHGAWTIRGSRRTNCANAAGRSGRAAPRGRWSCRASWRHGSAGGHQRPRSSRRARPYSAPAERRSRARATSP